MQFNDSEPGLRRKHPAVRVLVGLAVGLGAFFIIGAAFTLGADFWQDGKSPPVATSGLAQLRARSVMTASPALLRLTAADGQNLNFEISNSLARELNGWLRQSQSNQVIVEYSPQYKNVYTIKVGERYFVNNEFKPNLLFQDWQRSYVYLLVGVGIIGLAGLVFALVALLDWRLKPRTAQGILLSRVEQADLNSGDFKILMRSGRTGHPLQFSLNEKAFLATDGLDFIEVVYSPLFKYVWRLRSLTPDDLSAGVRDILVGLVDEQPKLTYRPLWRLRTFLYADAFFGLGLLGMTVAMVVGYVANLNAGASEFSQWSLIPMFVTIFGVLACYMLWRFRTKLKDVRAPKQQISGPVLSKWRVANSGPSNRHLIVVANGGLEAGEQAICKFDLHPVIFDQLRVGDIIQIEHTPTMRFICRLEVTGYQELTKNYQA